MRPDLIRNMNAEMKTLIADCKQSPTNRSCSRRVRSREDPPKKNSYFQNCPFCPKRSAPRRLQAHVEAAHPDSGGLAPPGEKCSGPGDSNSEMKFPCDRASCKKTYTSQNSLRAHIRFFNLSFSFFLSLFLCTIANIYAPEVAHQYLPTPHKNNHN